MLLFVPKELHPGERRVALTPEFAKKLAGKDIEVCIEAGAGLGSGHPDEEYSDAGAKIVDDRGKALSEADMVLRVRKPPSDEVGSLKEACVHISFLDPFNEHDLIKSLVAQKTTAISMEMVPRTTLAQKLDALSSQANLAGYTAVIIAAERLDKVFPMMMTPSGTITPSRVFVIGVGVAGLQAIATAKRLGARVEAFDTRPVVAEQVKSLGAKFVKIDLGETGQTKDGYAKELTEEQQKKQREGIAKVCAKSDVVITTAQLFGRKAPLIVTEEMIKGMKPGAVIVDLAVESGGNVACSEVDKEVDVNGVKIVGLGNLPGRTPVHASQMYSANMANMVEMMWNQEEKSIHLDFEDEIFQGCVIAHDGEIKNEMIKKQLSA